MGQRPRTPSPAPAMAGVLRQVAVRGLFADVLFFVVAVALGGVERDCWGAAGALVALVVVGNGRDGFVERFCHASSPLLAGSNAAGGGVVPLRSRSMAPIKSLDCFVAALLAMTRAAAASRNYSGL